jgi:O-antigen/teichoic acid export membrane protein
MADAQKAGNPLKRLLKQGGVYAIGNAAIKAAGLLLAPLYLSETFFSQVEFGQLVLLEATAQLLIPVVGLGLATGMLKFMADPELEVDQGTVPMTTLLPTLAMATVFVLIFMPLAPLIGAVVLSDATSAPEVRLLLVYIGMKVVGYVPLTLIRMRERAGLYATALLAETLLLIGGVYVALVLQGAGLYGVMTAYAVSAGASTLILLAGMLPRIDWTFRPGIARRLIAFGAPLAVAGMALPILHVGDRYLMEWLATTEDVAVYGWAARLAGILNMFLIQSFQLAFAVIGLKELGDRQAGAELHRRTFRHFCVWGGWAALGLSIVARDVTAVLATNEAYLLAAPMVLPLSLGLVLYGLYIISTNILYADGRTRLVAGSVFLAALLNIVLNFFLIPLLGGMGAALATLGSYGALGIVTLRIAGRPHGITFSNRVISVICLLVAILWVLSVPAHTWHWMIRALWYAILMALYPISIVLSGVYRRHEFAAFWQGARGRRHAS